MAFIDGQNLYHAAKSAFRCRFPNYDAQALVQNICDTRQWKLTEVRFYTGIPTMRDDRAWHEFWSRKLAAMGKRGIIVFSRPLRYHTETITFGGKRHTFLSAEEKGVDVRLALDVIRLAHRKTYDVALIFSQDQDLSEAVDEVKLISREQQRWLRVASAFPDAPHLKNRRGINGTDWILIDAPLYAACVDTRDYRKMDAGKKRKRPKRQRGRRKRGGSALRLRSHLRSSSSGGQAGQHTPSAAP